jgi:hypothetical protein
VEEDTEGFKTCLKLVIMAAKNIHEQKDDPDYSFFSRDKSHNISFYKQTPGVCTSSKQELNLLLRTTEHPDTVSDHGKSEENLEPRQPDPYWTAPSNILRQEILENNLTRAVEPLDVVMQHVPDRHGDFELDEVKMLKRKNPKKKTKVGGKKAKNLSKYSQREQAREIARNSKKLSDKIQIENLKRILGNPWDGVCFDEKKKFGLHFYYSRLQVI